MIEFITTGGIILDNVVAADGVVHLETLGGNAVYSAAGARLWSARVACVGLVPRTYPVAALHPLTHVGIDLGGLHTVDAEVDSPEWFFHRPDGSRVDGLHAPTQALAAFGLMGERLDLADARRFEAHLRTHRTISESGFGAFRNAYPVGPEHVPDAFWGTARGLHCAPNRLDAQHRLVRRAREAGLVVSLDPGRQAPHMRAADLDTLLTQCDVFLPSEAEIRVLAPGEEVLPALSRLAHQGRAIVVGKLGSRGSVVVAPDHEPIEVPPYPVSAPDPTGAGDAYAGGFMAGFAATGDPVVAACCATVSASFAVEDFGPYRLLAATAAEARKRLQHVAFGVPAMTEINRLATFLEHHA